MFLWVAAREASAANHYVTVKCPIDVLPSFRPHRCAELLYAVILSIIRVLHVNFSILYFAVCYFYLDACSNVRNNTLASPPCFLVVVYFVVESVKRKR